MRSMFDLFLYPERRRPSPQPRQVDLRRIIVVGLALWCAAVVVLLLLAVVFDAEVRNQLVICATGLGLGLLALAWEHTNRRRYRAVAETRDVVAPREGNETREVAENRDVAGNLPDDVPPPPA